MYRLTVLYAPPEDPVAFRAYYENTHLPLAAELPGLLGSAHGFDVATTGGASPIFCVWHGDFASAAALDAAMRSPAGQAVAADVPNYATGGATLLHYPLTEAPRPGD